MQPIHKLHQLGYVEKRGPRKEKTSGRDGDRHCGDWDWPEKLGEND